MTLLLRVFSVFCLVTLAVLSLLPAEDVVRTEYGGTAEHMVAYFGTAIATGMAFRKSPALVTQCALLIAYAAVLELLQFLSPGRTPALMGFAASAAGVVLGGACLGFARARMGWGL